MAETTDTAVQETEVVAEKVNTPQFEEAMWREDELQNIGNTLPIGLWDGSETLTSFAVGQMTVGDRVKLGQKAKRANTNVFDILPNFLVDKIEHIGGKSLSEIATSLGMNPEQPHKVLTEKLFYADLMTILFSLRLESVGEDIALAFQCTNCGTENKDSEEAGYHDLGSATVKQFDGLVSEQVVDGPLRFRFDLKVPIEYGGETITYFLLQPWLMRDVKKVIDAKSKHDIEIGSIMAAVCAIPESERYSKRTVDIMDVNLMNRLDLKQDFGRLKKLVQDLQGIGINLQTQTECYACGTENTVAFPWGDLATFLTPTV